MFAVLRGAGLLNVKRRAAALYLRVSSNGQDTGAQETALREYVRRRNWTIHGVYKDLAVSGARSSRPALDQLLQDCRRRKFDVVLVWKFDRFARSLRTLLSGLEVCRAFGIDFVSITEAVDTSLASGECLFQILGAMAQLERSLITERVRAGLDHARKNGQILGRPPLRKLTKKEIAQLRADRAQSKMPFRTLAEKFGVSVWTAHHLCSSRKRIKVGPAPQRQGD
jgi:DNA invertase Pin-like site-specific DNA recombinase